jgi:deoxycytidine triphosphate deaminase
LGNVIRVSGDAFLRSAQFFNLPPVCAAWMQSFSRQARSAVGVDVALLDSLFLERIFVSNRLSGGSIPILASI